MQNAIVGHNPFQQIKVRWLIVWSLLGMVPAVLLADLVVILTSDDQYWDIAVLTVLTAWPLPWMWWKLRRHQISCRDLVGRMPESRPWLRWLGTVAALLGFSIGSIYLMWYPLSFLTPSIVDDLILSENALYSYGIPKPLGAVVLEAIVVIIVAPIVEEISFRGIILHRWALKWNVPTSVILSSLLFGLLHLDVIGAVMFGFVMAVLYIKSRSLWPPIFCHAANNAAAYSLDALSLAAGAPAQPTIEDFRAGLWLGVVCLCLTLPLAVAYVVRNRPKTDWVMPFPSEPNATQIGEQSAASPEVAFPPMSTN
jgi:membrane protease YdiL (CAAX protease family)